MAIAEITVVPLGTGSSSLSQYVAKALRVLEESRIAYQLTPMGTVVEGETDQILALASKMHRAVLNEPGVQRVSTTVKIDERLDKEISMQSKVQAVKEKLFLR